MIQLDRRSCYVATLLFVVAAGAGQWLGSRDESHRETYSTPPGQERTITLADGSWAHLHKGTKMRARTTDGLIEIDLIQGGALFEVMHDSTRTFRVITPRGVAEDRGTQFEILVKDSGDELSVLEGTIWATGTGSSVTAKLDAGTKARMLSDGNVLIEPLETTVYGAATGVHVQHYFTHASRADAAAVFNRNSRSLRFVVEGPARDELFTGTFDGAEQFLSTLQDDETLTVTRRGGIVWVRSKRE